MSEKNRSPLPILSGNTIPAGYPPSPHCPVCNKDFKSGVAYITGGALLLDEDGDNSIETDRLRAIFSIGFHGVSVDVTDSVDARIVDDLHGGQFAISFCSLVCLKSWLNGVIDDLIADLG